MRRLNASSGESHENLARILAMPPLDSGVAYSRGRLNVDPPTEQHSARSEDIVFVHDQQISSGTLDRPYHLVEAPRAWDGDTLGDRLGEIGESYSSRLAYR